MTKHEFIKSTAEYQPTPLVQRVAEKRRQAVFDNVLNKGQNHTDYSTLGLNLWQQFRLYIGTTFEDDAAINKYVLESLQSEGIQAEIYRVYGMTANGNEPDADYLRVVSRDGALVEDVAYATTGLYNRYQIIATTDGLHESS